MTPPKATQVDPEVLSSALAALGLLYGASEGLRADCARAQSDAEAIRIYLERERPHLLACYELETLVELVRNAALEPHAAFEQYSPR